MSCTRQTGTGSGLPEVFRRSVPDLVHPDEFSLRIIAADEISFIGQPCTIQPLLTEFFAVLPIFKSAGLRPSSLAASPLQKAVTSSAESADAGLRPQIQGVAEQGSLFGSRGCGVGHEVGGAAGQKEGNDAQGKEGAHVVSTWVDVSPFPRRGTRRRRRP